MDLAVLGLEIRSDSVPVAGKRLGDFERQAVSADRTATRMGAAIGKAAAQFAILAGAAFSVQRVISTLAGFEQSMSAVQAITRASAEEMAALRDVARDLGATTEFSASQAADGLRFLGMAGFTATESVAAIPAVLNLATAAAMDLGSAADITSNIMSGFGIAAADAADVADVLAAASSRANTDVSQLGQAMSTVAPIAAALDISLADTAAAIGALSDAGIQGERAGTAMRGVLASLAGPTTQAQKVLANLGLTIGEVNPATNDLATIFGRLRDAGLSTADAMTIFGREAASGALVLVDAADRVGEFGDELSDVTGEAQRMADTMRDNLGGDLQGLVSSIEAVMLALGDSGLTGALRAGTQAITEILRAIAENMDAVLRGATGLAAFFAAQYVASMGAAAAATAVLAGALRVLRLAIAGTGIGALVLLVTDVVFRMYDASTATEDFSDSLDDAGDKGRSLVETMQIGAEVIVSAFDWAASSITTFFLGAFAGIRDGFTIMMNTILDGLSAIPGVEVGDWKGNPTAGTEAFLRSQNETRTAYGAMLTNWRRLTQGEWMDRDLGPNDIGSAWEQFNKGSGGGPVLSDLNDPNNPPGLGGGGKSLNAYEQATQAVLDNIAALERQQQAFGLSETAADRFNTAMDLLGAAQEAGIPITDELIGEINALADAHAVAGEAARKMADEERKANEQLEFNRNTFNGFFQDMKNGLIEGKSFWQALGDAGANALDKITSRALDMATNGIFDMLMGAFGGAFGGSLGGSFVPSGYVSGGYYPGLAGGGVGATGSFVPNALGNIYNSPGLSAYSGRVVSQATLFPFAKGIGMMGEAGPEAIMPLRRGPDGRLGVSAHNQNQHNDNSGGMSVVRVELGEGLEGRILQQAGRQSVQIVSAAAPGIVEQSKGATGSALRGGDFDGPMGRYGVQPQARRR